MNTTSTVGARLGQYLALCGGRAFAWPSNNCCHFAAGWVHLEEGRHPMLGLPATPNGRAALRLVRSMGHNLAAAVSMQLQRSAIVPLQARVGDVVLVNCAALFAADGPDDAEGTGQALGICAGRTGVFLDPRGAAVHLPMAQAVAAWHVGAHA